MNWQIVFRYEMRVPKRFHESIVCVFAYVWVSSQVSDSLANITRVCIIVPPMPISTCYCCCWFFRGTSRNRYFGQGKHNKDLSVEEWDNCWEGLMCFFCFCITIIVSVIVASTFIILCHCESSNDKFSQQHTFNHFRTLLPSVCKYIQLPFVCLSVHPRKSRSYLFCEKFKEMPSIQMASVRLPFRICWIRSYKCTRRSATCT